MDKIDSEVLILSRSYSALRRRQNKWKYRGLIIDNNVIMINGETFSIDELKARTRLKRSQKVFNEIYKLWQVVNPFYIPGLSKPVYTQILKFLYKALFKMHLSEFVFEEYLKTDLELDFKGDSCLRFGDFYDAVFDIIDQATNGKGTTEYVSCLSQVIAELKHSDILDLLNLNTKAHCQGRKPKYLAWMKEFLRIRTDSENLKSLPRIQSTKSYFDKANPLSTKKRSGPGMRSFLLEEIIEGRNRFLSAYNEEKRKIKAKEIMKIHHN